MSTQLDETLLQAAKAVFRRLYPNRAVNDDELVDHRIALANAQINSAIALHYLQHDHTKLRLTHAISNAMRDVFFEGRELAVADTPVMLKMIRDAATNINQANATAVDIAPIDAKTLLSVVEVVMTMAIQMVLPPLDYDVAKTIIKVGFQLLATNVHPVFVKQKCGCLPLCRTK